MAKKFGRYNKMSYLCTLNVFLAYEVLYIYIYNMFHNDAADDGVMHV